MGIVFERPRVILAVLQSLAQRIMEVQAVFIRDVPAGELHRHRGLLLAGQVRDLQICEAPVRLTQAGREADGVSVGGHGVFPAPDGSQSVSEIEPDFRLRPIVDHQRLIKLDRSMVFTHKSKAARQKVPVGCVVRIARDQPLRLTCRFGSFLLPKQGIGVGEPKAIPRRVQAQSVSGEDLHIREAVLAGENVRHQPQRFGIIGFGPQVGSKPCIRLLQPARQKRVGRRRERGIFEPGPIVTSERILGARLVSGLEQHLPQGAPGVRQIGLESRRLAQSRRSPGRVPQSGEGEAKFVLGVSRARIGLGERRQGAKRIAGVAAASAGRAKDQESSRIIRRHAQDRPGLLLSRLRIGGEDGRSALHGGVQGSGGDGCFEVGH